MAKKVTQSFTFSKDDLEVIRQVMKKGYAYSLSSCYGGFNVVRVKLDKSMLPKQETLEYQRRDVSKPDGYNNRLVFSSQDDAHRELLNYYKKTYEFLNSKL